MKNNPYKNKTLLMVGAGLFQCFAIKKAKRLGLRVVSIDFNPQAPGFKYCDDHKVASIRDEKEAIKALLQLHQDHPIHGIMTCGTDASYMVSTLAEKLNLPGISKQSAYWATHKGAMRERLYQEGVPVPDFYIADNLKEALKEASKIGFPIVIKPVDNMGARGVRKIQSKKELEQFFDITKESSKEGKVILESYLKGHEISLETIVSDQKVHLTTLADRVISGTPYFIERGHTLPSRLPPDIQKKALDMAIQGIKALKLNNTPSKFDMKITPNGPVIGEMTARLSGGFHCQMTDPLSTGLNTIKGAIDLALGHPINLKDLKPKWNRGSCERSLYPPPGKVLSIRGLEKASRLKGIAGIFLNVKPGDILYPLTSNIGKAGHIVGYGKNRKEAIKNTHLAIKTLQIQTEPL